MVSAGKNAHTIAMIWVDRYGGAAGALCGALSGEDHVKRLGDRLTGYFGRAALPLCSTDAAIHAALFLCGIKRDDYILVPSYTYYSYIRTTLNLGAVPVFIDSDPLTRCMSPAALETALVWCALQNKLPCAAMIDNAFGAVADYDVLLPLLKSYDVPSVELCCDALGGEYKGVPCGGNGDYGVVGLNKRIPGSGAALVCGDELTKAQEFCRIRYSDGENHDYGMSAYIAALDGELLSALDGTVARARKNYAALCDKCELVLPMTDGDAAAYAPVGREVSGAFDTKRVPPAHTLPMFTGARFFEHEQGFCACGKLAGYTLVDMDMPALKRMSLIRELRRAAHD